MDTIGVLREQLMQMWQNIVEALPSLAVALIVLIITWIVARSATRIADKITGRTNLRQHLRNLIETLVRIGVWIVGLLVAAAIAIPGFTPANLVAGLGIGALAIGFAFQDTFENFLAGVFVMLRDEMQIGDVIEVEGILGKIENINLRETHIRQLTNELFVLPNAMLFKNPVKIITDAEMRRDEIVIGVSYDTDLAKAEAAIRRAMESGIEGLIADKGVGIFAREFGGSSIDWLVQFWCDTTPPHDLRNVRTAAIKAIKTEFDAEGIDIPFPIVTNMFAEPVTFEPTGDKPDAANAA